jgi:signal transduction histidine kinase
MTADQQQMREPLLMELAQLRRQVAELEAVEAQRQQVQEETGVQARNLAAVSHLAIDLAAAAPEENVFRIIAESLRDLTGAMGVGITTYEPESQDLRMQYVATSSQLLDQINKLLGRSIFDVRTPVSPELYQRMVSEVIRIAEDLSDSTFGAVPKPIARTIQRILRIDHFAGLALHHGAELVGTAVLVMRRGRTSPSPEVLNLFAHVAAVSLRRKRAEDALQQQTRELEDLNRTSQALNASLDLDQVLSTVVTRVCDLLEVAACSVWLLDGDSGDLVCRCAKGAHQDVVVGWQLAPGQGLAGHVLKTGESLIVPDTEREPLYYRGVEQETGLKLRSILSVPLRLKDEMIGVLQVLDRGVDRMQHTDQVLMEAVASAAAIALENARLYADLQARMDQLKVAQAQLVQSAKMVAVGDLAAGVAHELNNPLMSIMGSSELLLERADLDDRDRQRLESVVRQAGKARDIIRNLLDFAHQRGFLHDWADVNEVLQASLALLRQRLEVGQIEIREDYAPDLPQMLIDANRMRQVFANLLTNAQQAMPQGGVLQVSSRWLEEGIAVQITDSGEGIPEEHLDRIFEPFFTTRPVGEGTGLGLSVSLGIVQAHGGRIEVESQPGQGSTFVVWLPIGEETADDY